MGPAHRERGGKADRDPEASQRRGVANDQREHLAGTRPFWHGLLLFFRVDDFDPSLQRARTLVARTEEEPHVNPNARTREFSRRDLDGNYVTISELSSLG